MRRIHAAGRTLLAIALAAAAAISNAADTDTTAGNLLVVLRESPGANKQQEGLQPFGKIGLTLADGREVEFEASWYQYLGDMHLRLVFEDGERFQSAVPEDLARLKLTPEQALEIALANLRKRYGEPEVRPYSGGLMQVQAGAPDLVSSYFLDRAFWSAQLRSHPEGIVAAVPARGGIVFAPATDQAALTNLRFATAALYVAQERMRLSSALYLFKDGRWSVFQPPVRIE